MTSSPTQHEADVHANGAQTMPPAAGSRGDATLSRESVQASTTPTELRGPYPGLDPYYEQDRLSFAGREREQDIIEANLFSARITVLYGASGVGKTSLLLAGALPELRRARRTAVIVFRTWQDASFVDALKREVLNAAGSVGRELSVDTRLQFDEFLLACAAATRRTFLFIFDQFEEYFLYHPPSSATDSFDAQFARAVNRTDIDAHFLLAMREDTLSGLDRFLGRIPTVLSNPVRLEHLTVEGARAAIHKPLDRFNSEQATESDKVDIDQDLIEAVLQQVKLGRVAIGQSGRGAVDEANSLLSPTDRVEASYLQLVMFRLWEEERRLGSHRLRLSTLNNLGGAQRIVQTHLDTEMQSLSSADRDIAAQVFNHLVTPSGSKIALGAADLVIYTGLSIDKIEPVVDRLSRKARVLRSVEAPRGSPDPAQRYEIYHDVLAAAILDWRARYLERAELTRRWGMRVRRVLAVLMVALLVMFGIAVSVSVWQAREAAARAEAQRFEEQTRAAQMQAIQSQAEAAAASEQAAAAEASRTADARENVARRLAGAAIAQLDVDPELSVRLARAAAEMATGIVGQDEAERALRRALAESRVRATLVGHYSELNSAVFSPDGSRVLTASRDGQARVWDFAAGTTTLILGADDVHITRASYNADGRQILTLCAEGQVVWDAATGRELRRLAGHSREVFSAVYSPNGEWIATASADGTALLWPGAGGAPTRLEGHTGPVVSATFSPDNRLVLTASDDQTARVWSVESGEQLFVLPGAGPITSASFSPDGQWILTTNSWDGKANLWDSSSGQLVTTMIHPRPVSTAVFSPVGTSDERLVLTATGGDDADAEYVARIWLVPQGTQVSELRGHTGPLFSAAFSPDGHFAVTASKDSTARVWETASGSLAMTLRGHKLGVSSAAFDAAGQRVVTSSWDGSARVWDVAQSAASSVLEHPAGVSAIAFSPRDGTRLASGTLAAQTERGGDSRDAAPEIRVWSTDTAQVLLRLVPDVATALGRIAFSADGTHVIAAVDTPTAWIWDAATGAVVAHETMSGGAKIAVAELSPDGALVATVADDNTTPPAIRDLHTDARIELKGHSDHVNSIRFSGDGRRIVTSSDDRTARVWDTSSGQLTAVLRGHSDEVVSAEFSPDLSGSAIVTASSDGTARLWDTASGGERAILRGHQGALSHAAFGPTGKLVVTAGRGDRTVRLWDTKGDLVVTLRGHSGGALDAAFSPDGTHVASASKDRTIRIYACEPCGTFDQLRALAAHRVGKLTDDERARYGGS